MPLITVILPTFQRNKSGMLERAIRSVLNQQLGDLELIVVDDGSIDGSADTVHRLMYEDRRLRTIRFENNVGLPALTTVAAYNASDSEFVAWQFDDSLWLPGHTEKLITRAQEEPDAAVYYAQAEIVWAGRKVRVGHPLDADLMLKERNHVPQAASITRRRVHERIGWYDPSVILKRVNDWDFWRRAVLGGVKFSYAEGSIEEDAGGALPDSLGNANHLDRELVQRLFNAERNAALSPRHSGSWSPYSLPSALALDAETMSRIALLFVDHAVQTGAWQSGRAWDDSHFVLALDRAGLSREAALIHWGRAHIQNAVDVRLRFAEAQGVDAERVEFIQQQRRKVDEQQAFIMQREQLLAEKQAFIHARIADIEALTKQNEELQLEIGELRRQAGTP